MNELFILAMLLAPQEQPPAAREERIREFLAGIAQSGRVVLAGETREGIEDPAKLVAPGAPPLLAFRYFQGADRHRFGNLDLMLDDAGH